ncbi:RNA-binding S4 domain-containing protein [Gilvimarinus algae]|uniref:Heat shock protein 15 n=1 Tax=Gilvimarinus algae TaxID=3058037 RepID=A0ABT8TBB1_9GAMM|nr:S4 domain-containing protein [Gilvimarinus sp. SDUM040014]MDO3381394.1 S4 domain-containing protein [Gilvimarinus sp. SDUM040014]
MEKVRIDKWLWAARFFKTRSIAKQAIEGGKIAVDGQKIKPSREIGTGVMLTIRQGWDDKTVEVIALSDQRRGAPEAQRLYRETDGSIALREKRALERKAGLGSFIISEQRPTKKQRRQIHRFKRDMDDQQD